MIRKMTQAMMAFASVTLVSGLAFAQDAGTTEATYGGMLPMAIALGIGLAALAGTMSQAKTASAALEGIARNPNAADKLFVPMILGLAFIESLVLFTWVLMLLMQLTM